MSFINDEARETLVERRRMLLHLERLQEGRLDEERASVITNKDRAQACTDDEVWSTLTTRERHEIEEIEGALARLDAGVYGRCATCGRAVGRQRLKALPETRHCVACSDLRAA